MASKNCARGPLQLTKFGSSRCLRHLSVGGLSTRPPQAPKAAIDIKHIRENPELYAQNCRDRNYQLLAGFPNQIKQRFEAWKEGERQLQSLHAESKQLRSELSKHLSGHAGDENSIREKAREFKEQLHNLRNANEELDQEIHRLAEALPNLTSTKTPIGNRPQVLRYVNDHLASKLSDVPSTSHVQIGSELELLDFSAAGNVSGWGWYYLKNEAALLEQALVNYALGVAIKHGFRPISPPSIVYSHIGAACGFQPRDQGGEQQIYTLAQLSEDTARSKAEHSLAGTAEIPFAGLLAKSDLAPTDLPLHVVGSSRCYRAEAGSRGIATKGLYRVHEFTKVEMFGWTLPDAEESQATRLFETMVSIQIEILEGLGLWCRVLEQPSHDLGASAARKQDIEAFFASRRERNDGWGEVTSTSMCGDYQTRRLATRVKSSVVRGEKMLFPHTVNGTALAVPRVLAALIETHWNEKDRSVRVPEVLWPWMHNIKEIRAKTGANRV